MSSIDATSRFSRNQVYEDLADFLAERGVMVVASLPCYLEENVDQQRGKGVYGESIRGLQKLNALGYGKPGSGLILDLVYNPLGPVLTAAAGRPRNDIQGRLEKSLRCGFQSTSDARQPPGRSFWQCAAIQGTVCGLH